MLRKLASILAIVFATTLALAGTALAAPYDPAVVVADRGTDGSFEVLGANFGGTDPDQYVTVTVTDSGGRTETYRIALDAEGNFAAAVPGNNCSATITVVGYPSGESRTSTISGDECNDPGDNGVVIGGNTGGSTSGGSASVGGTGYSSGGSYNGSGYSSGSGQGAYSNGYASTGSYDSGNSLASTGASIAAPVAIGLGTLVLGLGLLFFGTRGIVRRRGTGA